MIFILMVLITNSLANQNFLLSLAQRFQINPSKNCLAQVKQDIQDLNKQSSVQQLESFLQQTEQFIQKTDMKQQQKKDGEVEKYRKKIQIETDKIRFENLEIFEKIRTHFEKELKKEKDNFEEFRADINKILNQLNQQCPNYQKFLKFIQEYQKITYDLMILKALCQSPKALMLFQKPLPKTIIKPDPIEKQFVKYFMPLHRPGKLLREKNSVCFKVDANLSKLEIKQILKKLYNFKIKKINTQRKAGLKKLNKDQTSFLKRIYHRT